MATKEQWISKLEAAKDLEYSRFYVDLTLVCRFDAAINDMKQCTDVLADVIMATYHTRAMDSS